MPLTDAVIRNAKPGAKPTKMSDERGLFLLVSPSGGKWWRFRYDFNGKQNALALGVYPAVGLDEARQKRDEARQLLAQGTDPAQVRRQEKSRDRAVTLQAMDASTVKVSAYGGNLERPRRDVPDSGRSASSQGASDQANSVRTQCP